MAAKAKTRAVLNTIEGVDALHGNTVTAQFVEVTPALAAEWLGLNASNQRALDKPKVKELAEHMSGGRYFVAGAPVAFDTDGNLCNGQHTLQGIIASGITLTLLVIRGVHTDAIKHLDQGKQRTVADILAVTERPVKHLHAATALATIFMQGDEELRKYVNNRPFVADYVWEHREELTAWAAWAKNQSKNTVDLYVSSTLAQGRARDTKAVADSALAATAAIMVRRGADTDLVTRFWEAVISSTTPDTVMGSYTSKVRDYLRFRRPLVRGGGTQLPDLFRNIDTVISVYNAWRLGASVPMGRDIDPDTGKPSGKPLVKVTGGGESITYISGIVDPVTD